MTKALYPGQEGAPAAVFNLALQRPIPNFEGDPVSEISFREPRAADIMKLGNPVHVELYSDPPKITFDDTKMGGMLAALSNIPEVMIGRMHPQDYVAACWGLAGFFVPAGLMQS